jgi:LysM repeat protein
LIDATQPAVIQADHAHPRPKKRRRKRRALRGFLTGLTTGILILVVLLGAVTLVGTYGYFQLSGLILPGVYAEGVSLGGMNTDEATRTLQQTWPANRAITLTDGRQYWTTSASELGVTIDAAATAQRAYNVGREGEAVGEALALVDSVVNGTPVTPVARVDVEKARAELTTWAETVNVPPEEASLRLDGDQVVAVPGEMGTSLDVEATLATLTANSSRVLVDGRLPLTVIQVAPRDQDISHALSEAEQMLASDLAIQGYDPITGEHVQWTASREVIASWLVVSQSTGNPTIAVDEGRLITYLSDLGDSLGAGRSFDAEASAASIQAALQGKNTRAVSLVVKHPASTYTVQAGDSLSSISWDVGMPTWRILEANPSLSANSRLSVGQALTIPSPDDQLPLPVVPNKRIVVSIGQQRLWAYEDGEVLHEYIISTGIDRSPTQPGVFQVQTHDYSAYAGLWDLTMPHFLGIYEAWPGFMNGFHGLPTLSNGQILWADVLGRPASYGCIILALDDAETLYYWAEDGVVVEIVA